MRLRLLQACVLAGLIAFGVAACARDAGETEPATSANETNITAEWSEAEVDGWLYLIEELEIQELHAALSAEHRPENYVVENVNVITMTSDQPLLNQSVFVADGRVTSISTTAATTRPTDMVAYDGTDRWLVPGLTDMHTHNLDSHSQHILNLAMGVTTVRDLDGFPFLLKMRDAIAANELLAPSMFVSGTILNGSDFGGYALKISTPEEAREAVREQAQAGYDFIKTHNSLSEENFLAIADEAHEQGLDLVGHIPVRVSVEQAVGAKMRTFEHFKGYIIDSTLTLSDEDYVAATHGAEVWNTPTFSTYRNHLRGDEAAAVLANEKEMQLVPPTARKKWTAHATGEVTDVTALRQNIYTMSQQIFSELRTLEDAQFLAGTDTGSYELMPPGFMLLDELRIFQELGMTPYEAMQTATVNAAEAMRKTGDFGVIAPGAEASFVLLENNPLEDVQRLHEIEAVGVRGVWLDEAKRDDMLARLKEVYQRSEKRMEAAQATAEDLDDYLARLKKLHETGFVFRDHYLDLAASMYVHVGRDDDAAEITAMKLDPAFGFSWFRF
ncbi:MAG: hypothetical protein DHS20C05_06060 [Hyphococcus sp.]|nr:MAG: hypothetical protein DHS20C05_06060 [Marinicaulis sp.]